MALIYDPTLDSRVITKSYINNLKTKIMEKKEELLERVANEIAAQNKLIALLIAKEMGIENYDFLSEEKQIIQTNKKAILILAEVYKSL